MSIDREIIEERVRSEEEESKLRELQLKRDIEIGEKYRLMTGTEGWKMLEKAILERSSSLSGRLLSVKELMDLYRGQGEILGLQSILNIIDSALEVSDEAKNILKGE